jgi:type I restriction enzyme R subunit
MQDHGLFQAICRVNRLDGDDKEYGSIVDYKDLFRSLETSIHDYTSGALDGYDPSDVKGLLKNRVTAGAARLEEALESIRALCEPVDAPRDTQSYLRFFGTADTANQDSLKEAEPRRLLLYKFTAELLRAYADIANEMSEAGYDPAAIESIRADVDHYEKVRDEVKIASGDYIDLKKYEPAMRRLIDTYIRAEDSRVVSVLDDMSLVELIVQRGAAAVDALPKGIRENEEAVAETIENNVRKLIIDETPVNPKYYAAMSGLLDDLIAERRRQALGYEAYLAKVVALTKLVADPASVSTYPPSINTAAKRALFDNFGGDAESAIALDEEIRRIKKDGWRGNKVKEREVRNAIRRHAAEADVGPLFDLVWHQHDY